MKSFKHLNMITFKHFNKYFCGMLVLTCCLFGGVEVVEAGTDISGQCVELTVQGTMGFGTVSPEDICLSAGYGSCTEGNGTIRVYGTNNCTGGSGSRVLVNCSDVIGGGIRGSAELVNLE